MRDLLKYIIFSVATIWTSSCGQQASSLPLKDLQSLRELYPCCNCKMTAFIIDSIASKKNTEMITDPKHGKSAGNIDYVLVSYDKKGRVLDFGSLEVQSVYISGNLTGPFTSYLEKPKESFTWTEAFKYPKPDYLSSSRKRLIPQITAKGSILKQWNKKQAVALQTAFYDTLPQLPECDKSNADFAFFLYDLIPDKKTKTLSLILQRIVYTKFTDALEQIAKFEAGPISEFTDLLQKKLDTKLSGNSESSNLENIVVE